MKNQYFGDINDYRKYGLLRVIIRISNLRLLVAWMLTPDDGGTDGKFTSYLDKTGKWSRYDSVLFGKIKDLISHGQERSVGLIEKTDLLQRAKYFSARVPDCSSERRSWFDSLFEQAQESDLVFLDPDNGLEVRSTPYGRKKSSKYLYWCEVKELWSSGKSLLIYQHFIREPRPKFIERMFESLRCVTPGSFVKAFSTPYVVFFMAFQPEHQRFHQDIVIAVQESWQGQIQHWE